MITLTNRHIVIGQQIVDILFADAVQVCWVYYAAKHTMLVASNNDELFKSLHKTSTSILKFKNSTGDRSISVEELLLDNDLDQTDRILDYTVDEKMNILSIHFHKSL